LYDSNVTDCDLWQNITFYRSLSKNTNINFRAKWSNNSNADPNNPDSGDWMSNWIILKTGQSFPNKPEYKGQKVLLEIELKSDGKNTPVFKGLEFNIKQKQPVFTSKVYSPVTLILQDSFGNRTGKDQTEIYNEIPDAYYDDSTETIYCGNPDQYTIYVQGIEPGTYGLSIYSTQGGVLQPLFFQPTIPTQSNQLDVYSLNWEDIDFGINAQISVRKDLDGDGTFDTFVQLPSNPTDLTGVLNFHTANLNWNPADPGSNQIQGYQIYRSSTGINSWSKVGETMGRTVTIFADSTGTTGTTYDYYVSAVDDQGNLSSISNLVTIGPIQPEPAPNLSLDVTLNKTNFQYGEDVLYSVDITNSGTGPATGVELRVKFPSEIQYRSCTRFDGAVQPSEEVVFYIGTVPAKTTISFQINAVVVVKAVQEITASMVFDLSSNETETIRRIVNCILSPKKSGDSGSGIGINVLFKNTKWDSETGEKYIDFSEPLDAQFDITGFTQPFTLDINWGDGTKECLQKLKETCQNCKHKFISKGTMVIQITVTDATGKTKTVTAKIKVK
jgi:uncharacterized repeat protein (TIGR01451 family)